MQLVILVNSPPLIRGPPMNNQTRPKYTWRFLALNRLDKNAKPCRISVEAETEIEARCILAQHFIL
ncbi:host cell division inhibitor Icd-like protein, partial [Klebsiella pneumoniae]|uniref:host cell division inhibitor Icd-like protein n=1 Tax=Klebsiella pneumoniae TaxID=573 RepID=UPI0034A0D0C9